MRKGQKHSAESIQRLRVSAAISAQKRKGIPRSQETKEKCRVGNLGKHVSAETRARIGASSRGRVSSPETRAKISRALTGRIFTQEHRDRISLVKSAQFSTLAWKPTKPEMLLYERLDHRRFRYTANLSASSLGLPISTDILCRKARVLILVDGCFYHECPQHGKGRFPDKPNKDAKKNIHATAQGWRVLRFWEHDILQPSNLDQIVVRISEVCRLK